MPYFVYKITPQQEITLLATCDKYPQAKQEVSRYRREPGPGGGDRFRMVFGKDRQEARRLLTTTRELSSPLEEWEEKT